MILSILNSFSDYSDVLIAVATIIILLLGLREWKKQLKGKTEYELSIRLLRATYRIRDAIQEVRNIYSGDSYKEIWKLVSDEYLDLDIEIIESEILWGKEIHEIVKPLKKCIRNLYTNLRRHLNYKKSKNQYEIEKVEKIVFIQSNKPEDDEYTKKLESAVKQIENYVRPHMKL